MAENNESEGNNGGSSNNESENDKPIWSKYFGGLLGNALQELEAPADRNLTDTGRDDVIPNNEKDSGSGRRSNNADD